jgi:hypothetical protein
MYPEEIIRFLRAQPFAPFQMRISNGKTYEIRHPDLAIVTPSAIYVGIPKQGTSLEVATEIVVVSLNHVVEMAPLPHQQTPSAN